MFSSAAIVGDCLQLMEIREESIVPIVVTLSIDIAKSSKSEKIYF